VSSKTGEGIAHLLREVEAMAADLLPGDDAISLNRRQAAHLTGARAALESAALTDDVVLVAEHLRVSRTKFDLITGRAGIEDVLDQLFGRFCLGK
jgi:tRNA modification GTPase